MRVRVINDLGGSKERGLILALVLGAFLCLWHGVAVAAWPEATLTRYAPFPTSEDIEAVVYQRDELGTVLVLAGHAGGVLVSHDQGEVFFSPEVPNREALEQLVSVAPGVIAGFNREEIVISRDRGVSWAALVRPKGVEGPPSWLGEDNLVIAPRKSHSARSGDGGEDWDVYVHEGFFGADEVAVTLSGGEVFAAGRGGLAVSDDPELTWREIRLSDDASSTWLKTLSFSPDGSQGVVGGVDSLFRSQDAGKTWQVISLDERSSFVGSAVPDEDVIYLVSRNGGFWRSEDGGDGFELVELPEGEITSLSFADRSYGATAGASGCLLLTDDGGQSWRQVRRGVGSSMHSLARSSVEGVPHVALGSRGALQLSLDGVLWEAGEAILRRTIYQSLWVGEQLYAVAEDALYIWSWPPEGALDEPAFTSEGGALSVVPWGSGRVALLNDGVVYKSSKGSTRFKALKPPGEALVMQSWGDALFVGGDMGAWVTLDGHQWEALGPEGLPVRALVPLGTSEALVHLAGGGVVSLSGGEARLLMLGEHVRLGAAALNAEGAWFGGPRGLLLNARRGEVLVEVLKGRGEVVSLSCETSCVALTAAGWLYERREGVWGLMSESPLWTLKAREGFGAAEEDSLSPGSLVQVDGGVWVAGPGGRVSFVSESGVQDHDVGLDVDLYQIVIGAEGEVVVGGAGRSVLILDDGHWRPLSEDLAPELVTGVYAGGPQSWVVVTDSGRLLQYGVEDGFFHSLGVEQGPLSALIPLSSGGLVVGTGSGEVLQSAPGGFDEWAVLFEGPLEGRAISALGYDEDGRLAASGYGVLELRQEDEVWVEVGGMPAVRRVFQGEGRGLFFCEDESLWLFGAQGLEGTWSLRGANQVRDAVEGEGGWLVVGEGGLVGHLGFD